MNGIRPKQILRVLRAVEEQAPAPGEPAPVLATVISLDGSVYSSAGAMVLFAPQENDRPGSISLHDFDGELSRQLEECSQAGQPRLAAVDIAEDDPILGYNLGRPGRVEILLEPVDARLRASLREIREALLQSRPVVCAVEVEGPEIGRRTLYAAEDPAARECYQENSPELIEVAVKGKVRRTFLCPVHPAGNVLIFGSGREAVGLAHHLDELGFTVSVADPRQGRLRSLAWVRDRRNHAALIEGGWEQARAAVKPDENTAIVVMTHSYALDLETLQGALQSPAAYVGQIGAEKRTQRLLAELATLEVVPRQGTFFAPAGLDLGAETPEEVALAIAAEIFSWRLGRPGRQMTGRRAAVEALRGRSSVPGLILAAGRGKRFRGGHKLSASLGDKPVLRHVVQNALASKLDPVIVVLGCEAQAGLKAIEGVEDKRLRVVFNPLWESGKASSIDVGLREVPYLANGVMTLLGDMPMVKPWLINRVIEEFELSGKLAFPVFPAPDGLKKGYPTAFPRSLFGEIRRLTGDDTAMTAVREHWAEAVKIHLEESWTQADVDTAEDLELLAQAPSREESLDSH
jgi:xanthine/CO dehydrogenase XdhC/CoxF family maturation factor/molybdopterin-guanine dinucleotide biosynthesis protein A